MDDIVSTLTNIRYIGYFKSWMGESLNLKYHSTLFYGTDEGSLVLFSWDFRFDICYLFSRFGIDFVKNCVL